MSLFGSLFTGVSALAAQSQSVAIISNNIANVNTTGFKRSEASFSSLVTSSSAAGAFTSGTVTTERIQFVDEQGPLQQTVSSTDAAITGDGFFVVRESSDLTDDVPFLFTRAGQFSENAQGILENAQGFTLFGFPLDQNGEITGTTTDLDSLVAVDVGFLGGSTQATTSAELSFNLDANEPDFDNGPNGTSLPLPASVPADFVNGITVFDSLGAAQDLNFEFRKIVGPQANVTSTNTVSLTLASDIVTAFGGSPGIQAGDGFSINVGAVSESYIIGADAPGTGPLVGATRIDTIGDLINDLNTNINGTAGLIDASIVDGQLRIEAANLTSATGEQNFTLTDLVGTPLFGDPIQGIPAGSNQNFGFPQPVSVATTASSTAVFAAGTDDIVATLAGVNTGDVFTLGFGGATQSFALDAVVGGTTNITPPTVANLVGEINTFLGAQGSDITATFNATTGQIDLTSPTIAGGLIPNIFVDDPANVGNPIFAADGLGFSAGNAEQYVATDILTAAGPFGASQVNDFPGLATTSNINTQGFWEVRVLDSNGFEQTRGVINFNSDGTLNAAPSTTGGIDINLTGIDFGNGSLAQDIVVDITNFSQFAGDFDVIFTDQNGAELGLRTGISIDSGGVVSALFTNGTTAPLFQLPLATFAAPNSLVEQSGTAFSETPDSGSVNLELPGQGGAGFIEPSALEGSNVDLAAEFSDLIISQRAFTAGTRLISTVDELTLDLLNII